MQPFKVGDKVRTSPEWLARVEAKHLKMLPYVEWEGTVTGFIGDFTVQVRYANWSAVEGWHYKNLVLSKTAHDQAVDKLPDIPF